MHKKISRYYLKYYLRFAILMGVLSYLGFLMGAIAGYLGFINVDPVFELSRGLIIRFLPTFASILTAIYTHKLLRLRYWIVLLSVTSILYIYRIYINILVNYYETIYGYIFEALLIYISCTSSLCIGLLLSKIVSSRISRKVSKKVSNYII